MALNRTAHLRFGAMTIVLLVLSFSVAAQEVGPEDLPVRPDPKDAKPKPYKSEYESGQHLDGLKTGEWREYYDREHEQTKRVEHWKSDKRHGQSILYRKDGGIAAKEDWRDGERHGWSSTWHPNNQRASECYYDSGKLRGASIRWHDNGMRKSEALYVEGSREGHERTWYANGELKAECPYKDGVKHGVWRRWHENGTLAYSGEYREGSLVKETVQTWDMDGNPVEEQDE